VLVLRALSGIESAYLSKCSIRLNEAIGQAFVGGARLPPSTNEAVTVVRAIANEMDGAKFDPILVKMVARTVKTSMGLLLGRVDSLVCFRLVCRVATDSHSPQAVRDRSAFVLLGPAATSQQISNAQITSFLWHLRDRMARLEADHAEATFAILAPTLEVNLGFVYFIFPHIDCANYQSVQDIEKEYVRMTDPLLSSVRRELGALIARLHKLDLGSAMDAGMGMGMAGGSASLYMRELVDKLTFVKMEIFANFNIGEARRAWSAVPLLLASFVPGKLTAYPRSMDIARYVLRTFTLHMSIARPLGEGGKLQLTTDMTELEFALSAFVVDPTHPQRNGSGMQALGDEYRMLRAMRFVIVSWSVTFNSPGVWQTLALS
jgi:conserved oligomeric Golgi complex subunit 5